MDNTGPYPLTPRRHKYLLTFADHFLNMQKLMLYQKRRPKYVLECTLERSLLVMARFLSWLPTKAALSCPRF